MLRFWSLLLLSWVVSMPPAARAGGAVPLRKLCIESPLIVLATPVDPLVPVRFRITAVLRATTAVRPAVGDTFTPLGFDADQVRTFDEADSETKKVRRRSVTQALLFLEPRGDGTSWRLRPTGFRFCTDDGRLLGPADDAHRPVVQSQRWVVILRRVKEDIVTVAKLNDLCRGRGRPARRVETLLEWIDRHKGEFATVRPGTDEAPTGWDRLQLDLFDALFALAGIDDAWRAVRLYAEVNGNEAPKLLAPTFTSTEGRALLLRLALDVRQLGGDRERAVNLLAQRITLWPTLEEQRRGATSVTAREQSALLDGLASLMGEKGESFKVEVIRAVRQISLPDGQPDRRSAQAVPALVKAYKDTQPGAARDELALTLSRLATPAQWKELTGNPVGVCVVLGDLERQESSLTFWLTMQSSAGAVYDAPTLIVERLGNFGFIAETKRLPLAVLNLPNGWPAGWSGRETLVSQVDLGAFIKPGNAYRVKVEGSVGKGKDRQKWLSEPRKFVLLAAPAGAPRYDNPYSK